MRYHNVPATDHLEVRIPPPPLRCEAVPPPRPGYAWVRGYWDWRNSRHSWVIGHWEAERRGCHWKPHCWVTRDGRWHLQPGGWVRGASVENVLPRAEGQAD